MITPEIEIFTREDYAKLRSTWLTYIAQERSIRSEYFLLYTLIKGKSPFKVFSPLTNPHKIEIAAREHGEGPWKSLRQAAVALQNALSQVKSPAVFTLTSSRHWDPELKQWVLNHPHQEIALSDEQVIHLLARLNQTLDEIKQKS